MQYYTATQKKPSARNSNTPVQYNTQVNIPGPVCAGVGQITRRILFYYFLSVETLLICSSIAFASHIPLLWLAEDSVTSRVHPLWLVVHVWRHIYLLSDWLCRIMSYIPLSRIFSELVTLHFPVPDNMYIIYSETINGDVIHQSPLSLADKPWHYWLLFSHWLLTYDVAHSFLLVGCCEQGKKREKVGT